MRERVTGKSKLPQIKLVGTILKEAMQVIIGQNRWRKSSQVEINQVNRSILAREGRARAIQKRNEEQERRTKNEERNEDDEE